MSQVGHFLDWAVYEGELTVNPFATVKVETKGRNRSYAALTDAEVASLLALDDPRIGDVLVFCLLTGMRAGEAVGLVRGDLVWKGNLGWFAWVRPNEVRTLKTEAAERLIPLHSALTPLLAKLPREGRLFPGLSVAGSLAYEPFWGSPGPVSCSIARGTGDSSLETTRTKPGLPEEA